MARPVNRYGLFSYSFIGQQAKDRTQALQWLIRHHDQPNHHQYLIIEEFSKEGFLKSVFNGNCRASIPRGCVWWNVDGGLRLEKGICHVNTNWSLIVYHWSKNLTLRQAITFWSIFIHQSMESFLNVQNMYLSIQTQMLKSGFSICPSV